MDIHPQHPIIQQLTSMSNKKGSSTMRSLGMGTLLGVGLAYVGSKIIDYFKNEGAREGEQVQVQSYPIPPIDRQNRESEGVFTAIDAFHCPISLELMTDPVIIIKCSHTFERNNIRDWLQNNGRCPVCSTAATLADVKPNYNLKNAIIEIRRDEENKKSLLAERKESKREQEQKQEQEKVMKKKGSMKKRQQELDETQQYSNMPR